MKKKLVLVVIFVVGLILFLENACKISVFENIGNFIDKQDRMSDSIEENATRIDVTGIELGAETEHEHLYKTRYNENKHWEECMACGEKRNENKHIYKRTWASGTESCDKFNYYTDTCLCGYSIIGYKPCVWDGKTYKRIGGYCHIRTCSICKYEIYNEYYLKKYDENSQKYSSIYYTDYVNEEGASSEKCHEANGKIINCGSFKNNTASKTCVVCKMVYNSSDFIHYFYMPAGYTLDEYPYKKGDIFCLYCGEKFGTYENEISHDNETPVTYTINTKVNLSNGAKFSSVIGDYDNVNFWKINEQNITEINSDKTVFTLTTTYKAKQTYKSLTQTHVRFRINISGKNMAVHLPISSDLYTSPDLKEPIISNIAMENEETLTIWSKTKPIIISGTENYCDTVKVEIIDDEGNTFFTGNAVVTNGSYTISCTPELEVDASGKRFKAIVTDACNNKTEQEFEIARVDAIAPKITSGDELGGNWAKSKKITFSANDYGIGEVQIGFNSSDDYELASKDGQSYSREYELFGDVYEPREANVYYKDGLGNISTKKIIIDKLDNTAPTITNVNIHNNKLTVEANDIHEIWGEGSGIVKYRYLSSGEKIENIDESILINEIGIEENIVIPNLPEVKYVYVVAEDLVRKHK